MKKHSLKVRYVDAVELQQLDARARAREIRSFKEDRSIKMPSILNGRSKDLEVAWPSRV